MSVYIYDIEQFRNCHVAGFAPAQGGKYFSFTLWKDINQLQAYIEFLSTPELELVGFNNLEFDYPIIHYLLLRRFHFAKQDANQIAAALYKRMTQIMKDRPFIREEDMMIRQIDLYKLNHYDNVARHASLKHIEAFIHWENVQDMPIHHTAIITTREQLDSIISYNRNDVLATRRFNELNAGNHKLRRRLSERYHIDLTNASEARMGEQIILGKITQATGQHARAVPYDTKVDIEPLLSKKVQTSAFSQIISHYKRASIDTRAVRKALLTTFVYDGAIYTFGMGGMHAFRKAGIYYSDEETSIMSCDAKSFYPFIAISNSYYPRHIGPVFIEVMKEMYKERTSYDDDAPEKYGLKIGMNAATGKSFDGFSPLGDPAYFPSITINGQLFLAMLCEWFTEAGFKILMVNTDGIECQVPAGSEGLYRDICKRWEQRIGITLEIKKYKSLFVRDVSNYISVDEKGKIKGKGEYETHAFRMKMGWWHKSPSYPVVANAVQEYFVNDIPIMETLQNTHSVLDFCLYERADERATFYFQGHTGPVIELPRTIRYFIANDGGRIFKKFTDGRTISLTTGLAAIVYNKTIKEWEDDIGKAEINYQYYLQACNKLITPLEDKQLNLWDL